MKVSRLLCFAFLLSSGFTLSNAAVADDNCEDQKDSLKRQWANGIVRFGSCYRATPESAFFEGWWGHCGEVLAAGGMNPRAGHRGVAAWVIMSDGQVVHLSDNATYLGYCAANKASAPADPATADSFKNQLEELRAKITE